MTLPENTVFSVVYHLILSFHFQFCQNILQISLLPRNFTEERREKMNINLSGFFMAGRRKNSFFS